MEFKKYFRLTVMCVLALCMLLVSGCSGDKFAGKWMYFDKFRINVVEISQNGSSYNIVKSYEEYSYKETYKNKAEVEASKNAAKKEGGLIPMGTPRQVIIDSNIKQCEMLKKLVAPVYDYTYTWQVSKGKISDGYVAKDNVLYYGQTPYLSFNEKDKTLLISSSAYVKYDPEKVKKIKEELQASYKAKFEKDNQEAKKRHQEFITAHDKAIEKLKNNVMAFGPYSLNGVRYVDKVDFKDTPAEKK